MHKQKNNALPTAKGLLLALLFLAFGLNVSAQNASVVGLEADGGNRQVQKQEEIYEKEMAPADSGNLITAATYAFTAASGAALEDMSSGTTLLVGPNLDDTASTVTNIGFDFWYDGVRYTQFSVNANGVARLGSAVISTAFNNATGFATTTNAPKIAPYFDDLWVGTNGKVHYKIVGAPGSRKLVVEWQNMQIPRVAADNAGAGTFQLWLNESTGVIEFVYGSGIVANSANSGYTIGLQAGAATNFASVTTTDNSVSYTTHNATQTNEITAGTKYAFTPNAPAAPTNLSFSNVGATELTLSWTDNASNEISYAIYRSTDGVNFALLTELPAGTVTFTDTFLSPSTTYSYRVYAVSEGALSAALAGTQATNALGNVSSTAAGGNWSNPATWSGGVVPTASDNVTIVEGAIVTIDTNASAYNLNIGSNSLELAEKLGAGAAAVLQFEAGAARTLSVGNNVAINSTGVFRSAESGTVTTHNLSLRGNLTNNGVLDFSTNANTAGAGITFTGPDNAVFGGSGATTDVRAITVNKGTSNATLLELNPANFTVQGSSTDSAGYLTLTNGTLKISGTFTIENRTFTAAAYTIPATAGFWLNNPNYTVSGQNGSSTMSGLFRMTQGTFNIGTSTGNSMAFTAGSRIIVEGGAINAAGRFGVTAAATAINYTQTGGTITVQTVGNTSTTLAGFDMGTSTASFVTISGGTIVIQLANTAASGPRDYRHQSGSATTSAGIASVTGGIVQFGNAASGSAQAFDLVGVVPHLVVSGDVSGHSATYGAPVNWNNITRDITINAGGTFNIGNQIFLVAGETVTNNGTLTANGAASRFYWFGSGANIAQKYTGSGTSTAPMTSFDVDNALGVTLDPGSPNIVVRRIILFTGDITNANKLTLGNNDATVNLIQFGNTTTPLDTGVFDVAPTFNLGAGGQSISYLRTVDPRTTGPEINPARSLVNLTYDDNDPSHDLTIAGGDLTVTGTLALTNGVIVTGANTLTHNGTATRTTGYVNGTLNRSYAAVGSYTYHVGANGYSPMAATLTALGTNPSALSVGITDAVLPGLSAATAVSRHWTLTETGDLTANLTFTYRDEDVNGNEANYKVFKRTGGAVTEVSPSTVTPASNTASVTGITEFSGWGIGEALAPSVPFADIAGKVTGANGALAGVRVFISDGQNYNVSTITNAFGNYSFRNVPTGANYTISVGDRRYTFAQSTQNLFLIEDTSNINFAATGK